MASRDNKKASRASSSRTGKIRTLSDLNRPSADSDSDSDGPQEYYTGGEKSGMLVQDPSKGNDVDAIFNQARQLGAIERPLDQLQEPPRSTSFTGTGRLLSGETAQSTTNPQPEAVVHNIVFWSNGFTVNDGPLRRLDDPENASFLESIKKSDCPKELEPADRRSSVNVNLIRRNENYPVRNPKGSMFHFREWEELLEAALHQWLLTQLCPQLLLQIWLLINHCRPPQYKSGWLMEPALYHNLIIITRSATSVPSLMHLDLGVGSIINFR
ncbi:plant UBX domain-containing protein 4-like isoform X2 [Vigna umbellata]|uniref:plant UBX domain-containing protein 4-like isoform X2 n=1 Tax=Vigna umbellata TaxID=87088 RepID=UPI001F5F1879|nr:plant UBX domain-containing protein 4-like isoform X2 [Vigna umbellata]